MLSFSESKSVNLQYNLLVRRANGTTDSSTKRLMLQVLFFFLIKSCKILCKNPLNLFFYKMTKMKIKSFECPKSINDYEKNTWKRKVRCLVNKLFVPSAQQTSILYCRLFHGIFDQLVIFFSAGDKSRYPTAK